MRTALPKISFSVVQQWRFESGGHRLPEAVRCAQVLAVRRSTTTPMWKGLEVMLKYRSRNNYMSPYYLFSRLFDKIM